MSNNRLAAAKEFWMKHSQVLRPGKTHELRIVDHHMVVRRVQIDTDMALFAAWKTECQAAGKHPHSATWFLYDAK
jgi:hypothetical protein